MSGLDKQEADVLAYYGREHAGTVENSALAGLALSAFRAARERLVRKGLLTRSRGRYVPVNALRAA